MTTRDTALVWHQVRYEQLSFWRNPQSAFFTFVLPVVVITAFGAMFGSAPASDYFDGLPVLRYYVATIGALSVLGSCFSQLAIVLAARRQNGLLKRVRATPLPAWAYFLGLLAHCLMVSVVDVLLVVAVGRVFGAPVPGPGRWLAIVVTVALGAAAFCALGVAVASLIRNAEAAPAVVQFVLFPLVFVSGTYLPIHSRLVNDLCGALPVRPFNQAMLTALGHQDGFAWPSLGVLAIWGAAGAVVAVRRFRWDPRPE
jgi:ABC-2 type transport system permease protein